jgi:hypothetical protein
MTLVPPHGEFGGAAGGHIVTPTRRARSGVYSYLKVAKRRGAREPFDTGAKHGKRDAGPCRKLHDNELTDREGASYWDFDADCAVSHKNFAFICWGLPIKNESPAKRSIPVPFTASETRGLVVALGTTVL